MIHLDSLGGTFAATYLIMSDKNETKKQVIVKIKNVYGNELICPVNEDAISFSKLVGQKTLSRQHLELIKSLGFEVVLSNAYNL